MKRLTHAFFYGNVFYGVCAIALCIETNLVHHLPLNSISFYSLIFLCTWLYYTMIYVRSRNASNSDERTVWYRSNFTTIKSFLKIAVALVIAFLLYVFINNWNAFHLVPAFHLAVMAAFPFVAGLYTFKVPFFYFPKIRQIGWLKPFVVGLIWSGWVTAYPLIFGQIERADPRANFVLPSVWFWLQNFLFISILAIIFDIKDLRTDARFNLNTYPARLGIINTFRYVIYPLAIFTVIAFALFHIEAKLLLVQIFIQTIPYLLLTSVILTHRKPKNLLYYLVAIDGLMFLKAVCGSISILFF